MAKSYIQKLKKYLTNPFLYLIFAIFFQIYRSTAFVAVMSDGNKVLFSLKEAINYILQISIVCLPLIIIISNMVEITKNALNEELEFVKFKKKHELNKDIELNEENKILDIYAKEEQKIKEKFKITNVENTRKREVFAEFFALLTVFVIPIIVMFIHATQTISKFSFYETVVVYLLSVSVYIANTMLIYSMFKNKFVKIMLPMVVNILFNLSLTVAIFGSLNLKLNALFTALNGNLVNLLNMYLVILYTFFVLMLTSTIVVIKKGADE